MKDKIVKEDIGMIDEIIELLKNLTSLEAHAQASYKSTGDERFLKAKAEYRKIRTTWLKKKKKKNFGQIWCQSKHSCEALMRLDEIQTRFLSLDNFEEAKKVNNHYDIIFNWLLELNDLNKGELKAVSSA